MIKQALLGLATGIVLLGLIVIIFRRQIDKEKENQNKNK
jgi:hypothetical protein